MAALDSVLPQLEALLGPVGSEPEVLGGGLTNTNFRVLLGGHDCVVRLPGADTELLGIDRDAERAATELAAGLGLGPEVLAALDDPRCLVTGFIVGAPAPPETLDMTEVATALRALHDSGATLPLRFDTCAIADAYAALGSPPPAYRDARAIAGRIDAALAHPDHAPVPCHDDLLNANLIHDGARLRIVDWEYAGMGDRFFDLGNFAVNNGLDEEREEALLVAYFGACSERRYAALRMMRFMSDLREAMWGVAQTAISSLDFDYEDYAAQHFARLEATAADPRFGRWLEAAAHAEA